MIIVDIDDDDGNYDNDDSSHSSGNDTVIDADQNGKDTAIDAGKNVSDKFLWMFYKNRKNYLDYVIHCMRKNDIVELMIGSSII